MQRCGRECSRAEICGVNRSWHALRVIFAEDVSFRNTLANSPCTVRGCFVRYRLL